MLPFFHPLNIDIGDWSLDSSRTSGGMMIFVRSPSKEKFLLAFPLSMDANR